MLENLEGITTLRLEGLGVQASMASLMTSPSSGWRLLASPDSRHQPEVLEELMAVVEVLPRCAAEGPGRRSMVWVLEGLEAYSFAYSWPKDCLLLE